MRPRERAYGSSSQLNSRAARGWAPSLVHELASPPPPARTHAFLPSRALPCPALLGGHAPTSCTHTGTHTHTHLECLCVLDNGILVQPGLLAPKLGDLKIIIIMR